jgi:hypothetical protein
MKLFPARSRTKMGQLVCNEVETTVMRLSLYEAEPIDFAFASAAVGGRGGGGREGEKGEEEEDEEGESDR